jgi:hypothetical protein
MKLKGLERNAVRRMETRTENEKQQNQVTDTLHVQLDVNDLARYGELMSPATTKSRLLRSPCRLPDNFLDLTKFGFSTWIFIISQYQVSWTSVQ